MWVFAFLLAAPWAMAQKDIPPYGFAGEDRIVLNPGQVYFTVQLGLDEVYDNDDSYYEWTLISCPDDYTPPPTGTFPNGGNFLRKTIANVSVKGDYIFCLTRLSKYGYQKDEVRISVKDIAEIVMVKPKKDKECFKPDVPLSIEDFEIVTNPIGYNRLVMLAEDSQTAGDVSPGSITESQEIHFLVKHNDSDASPVPSNASCKITVFEEVQFLSAEFSENDIVQALSKISESVKDFAEVLEKLNSGKQDEITLEESPISPICDVFVDLNFYRRCCGNIDSYYLNYVVKGEFGVGIRIPLPIVPGLYGLISGKFVFSPDLSGFVCLAGNDKCGDPFSIDLIGRGEIGAGLGVGSPGAVNLEAIIVGGIEGRTSYVPSKHKGIQFVNVKADLKVNVTIHYVIGSFSWDFSPFGEPKLLYGEDD